MRSENLLDTLIGLSVLEPSEDDEALSVTQEFEDEVTESESELGRNGTVRESLRKRFDDPDVVDSLAAIGEDDRSFVAHYCALADRTDDLSHDELVRTVTVLVQLRGTQPRTEGVPDSFLPVRGEQLPTLLQLTSRAVVYVWLDDCEPCDVVRETLDGLLEEPPGDIALFAVYAPDSAELLYEEFEVNGAPVTLFVIDGEVDSRLSGAHYPESYEGEIEMLRELS